MSIKTNLDLELVKTKMSLTELATRIDISITNLSLLKNGRVKGIRLGALDRICTVLNCQPGDILQFVLESPVCEDQLMTYSDEDLRYSKGE